MTRSIEQIIERQLHRWDRIAATLGYDPLHPPQGAKGARSQAQVARQPVIAISRDLGVHEGEIARGLAAALDYEIFGKAIIDRIAEDVNVQRRFIDERDEHLRSALALMIEGSLAGRHIDNREYFESLARVLRGVARRGGVIILGRGATILLRGEAALSVRLVAGMDERIRFLCEQDQISEREARAKIDKSDRERHGFVRHFFHADINNATLYDIVINTGRFTPEACIELILAALKARGVEIRRHVEV